MKRYLKIIFLSLLLLAVLLVMISVPIFGMLYVYLGTEGYPIYVRLPVLILSGVFLVLMGYGGLKKGFSKTKLFKKKDTPKSKLP